MRTVLYKCFVFDALNCYCSNETLFSNKILQNVCKAVQYVQTFDVLVNNSVINLIKCLDTSAAVRLALGETQLVAETKTFLENNGVYLDAFNKVIYLH